MRRLVYLILLILLAGVLASCSPAGMPTPVAQPTVVPTHAGAPEEQTPQVQPTQPPQTERTPTYEPRTVELEYPLAMDLGNSDTIRLSLVPTASGYEVRTEFPDHQIRTEAISVERPQGLNLFGVARLDAAGFEVDPDGEQALYLYAGQAVTWRWSITPRTAGTHRLALRLSMRWVPQAETTIPAPPEQLIYSSALQVDVRSVLGMSPRSAASGGVVFLSVLLVAAAILLVGRWVGHTPLRKARINPAVQVIAPPGTTLDHPTTALMQSLFASYAHVLVEAEFRSGYSGSRTWLVLPEHADGRHDARTIVKIGSQHAIRAEYASYEQYVKDTLPPVTARIQHPPVRLHGSDRAALRYTFIGLSGQPPVSLKSALLRSPDPAYLERLFDTFAPDWWMQRTPSAFHLEREYDRILPAHLVIRPIPSGDPALRKAAHLSALTPPAMLQVFPGDLVRLSGFSHFEPRVDGDSLSIESDPARGMPVLRLRWMGKQARNGDIGRVAALRADLMAQSVEGLDRLGLPDPLPCLPHLLAILARGSLATIHGDLNLENILVGPGDLVWLIDFAQTRRGDPMVDLAHLYGEIVAHVLSAQAASPEEFLAGLRADGYPLLNAVTDMAEKLQVSDEHRRAALALTCLGMLKYENLTPAGRECLYISGAFHSQ